MRKNVLYPLLLVGLSVPLAFARLASSQPAPLDATSSLFILPVAVHTPGQFNSFFKTHVAFYNPTNVTFPVQVTLYDSNGAPHVASFTLTAHQSVAYADFVNEVFHLTGAGTVKFDAQSPAGGSTANKFALSAEVYTNGPCGDFGTTVPPVPLVPSASESISPGITANSVQRTNVACFNESGSGNHVIVEVYNQLNNLVATTGIDLPGNAWAQVGINTFVEGGYIRFRPSAAAYCYAVVVTNASNDGRFIPGQSYP